jgi:hypothetical protein
LAQFHREWLTIAAALCLSDCAAQNVTPVSMTQAGDDQLTCPALFDQIKANRAEAEEFLRKDRQVEQGNIAKNVAGSLLAPIGLLLAATTDLSNADQVKARAIADRNEQLIYLAKSKGCKE